MFEEQTRERALSSTLIRIAAVQSVIALSKSSFLNSEFPESLKVLASDNETDALIDEAKIIAAFKQLAQSHSANDMNFEVLVADAAVAATAGRQL